MKKIAIIGAGGLGREVLGILKSINNITPTWNIIGFYDDGSKESEVNSLPILGDLNSLNELKEDLAVVIAVGNPLIKKSILSSILKPTLEFPNIFHPSVIIYDPINVNLGKGIVIGANTVLTTNIEIDDFVYINTAVVLAHDVVIKEYAMLMPTVVISAGATIGALVYLGNGVKIDKPLYIPDKTIVPMGTIISNKKILEKL